MSVAHSNAGSCGSGPDTYHDAVWTSPGTGGGNNPTTPAFCAQNTYIGDTDLAAADIELTTSCTSLNNPMRLDRKRIDYIWVAWERPSGASFHPPAGQAGAYINYASADTGMNFTSAIPLDNYSDHRMVQALLTYPLILPHE